MKGIVLYWKIVDFGGGERLAKYTADALGCEVYTLNYLKRKNKFGFKDLTPTLPFLLRKFHSLPFMDYIRWANVKIPNIEDYDFVISLGARARAFITPEHVMHVHYMLSVERWLYDLHHRTLNRRRSILQRNLFLIIEEISRWVDSAVDPRVDFYISISEVIKRRLWKYLKRDSEILYPPIFFRDYKFKEYGDFYLFISRLYPEKRVMETVKAFAKMKDKKLVICGEGPEAEKVKQFAKKYPNIEYLGYVDRETKIDLLARCRAVICPYVGEDFGIVPIEALASGKPIIVTKDGGFPKLLVERHKCGVITDGSVEGLIDAVKRMDIFVEHIAKQWTKRYRNLAKQFDYYEYFKPQLNELIKKFYKEFWDILG